MLEITNLGGKELVAQIPADNLLFWLAYVGNAAFAVHTQLSENTCMTNEITGLEGEYGSCFP